MEKYNYVMRYCLSTHAHVLLRTIWLKHTYTTRAHEFTSRAHDLHNMKKPAP